jgi:hypothetical protein
MIRRLRPAQARLMRDFSMQHFHIRHVKTRRLARAMIFQSAMAVTLALAGPMHPQPAAADDDDGFRPGNLLVSRSVYDDNPNNVVVGAQLPPNCTGSNCVSATANGTYPEVFNNVIADGSFGITSAIFLDEMTPRGEWINSFEVPNSAQRHIGANSDQMVTSFSSKSEMALNLSTDRRFVTFMGYLAPVDTLDVSNSNTPAVIDPTDPVPSQFYRVVAKMDERGRFTFTKTNAYSGNNGRAAVLNAGANVVYTAGNAGNGGNPQPAGVIVGGGTSILAPSNQPLGAQIDPGLPTPVGSFNITELGDKADKIGKDTNFRGLTIFNNVVYLTKGSGSNGVNSVYFIDTSGAADANGNPAACPAGTGLPAAGAVLPATPIIFNAANLAIKGVFPYNMCILKGFTTTLAKSTTNSFPFGIWFANATTLYLADEGNGDATFSNGTFTTAAGQTTAGLQKWVFDATSGQWKLAYVLSAGLDLGVPYTVKDYPSGNNAATGLPWSPATDGLRNLTGRVNRDGTVTIWAITSTVSGGGDQGADPNKLVAVTDQLAAATLPAGESFRTLRTAKFAEVLRGISFTPGTGVPPHNEDDDGRQSR